MVQSGAQVGVAAIHGRPSTSAWLRSGPRRSAAARVRAPLLPGACGAQLLDGVSGDLEDQPPGQFDDGQ